MNGKRAEELDALGIVWDTGDQTFAENLAAARAYFSEAGTLAAPRHATALDKPVGQWLTNIRRPGGLGKDPVRADQLAAIDRDWNPAALGWTVDWQRHHVGLAALLRDGATWPDGGRPPGAAGPWPAGSRRLAQGWPDSPRSPKSSRRRRSSPSSAWDPGSSEWSSWPLCRNEYRDACWGGYSASSCSPRWHSTRSPTC
ncbi:helicase associated domain-containing protein [Streptomyces sp. NPDC051994]|uniref:helicase associated domain-containing protein n=1 Tax=unclassified Streptomyces TaxID=2593676 RepID=UPI00342364E1